MLNPEVESYIKSSYSWTRLPSNVKQTLGNVEKNWERCVSDYCIKNQLRFKGTSFLFGFLCIPYVFTLMIR